MKLNISGKIIEVNDEDISKAIEEKQESIDIQSDFVIRTSEEEETFSSNLKNEGITIGSEIGRKGVIKSMGIDIPGAHKSDTSTIEAINSMVETKVSEALINAKIEPDKKVEELTADLNALRQNASAYQETIDQKDQEFKEFKNKQIISSTLSDLVPENTSIPKKDILVLMNANIKTDVDDNGVVFALGSDGSALKDQNRAIMPIKNVVDDFFRTNDSLLTSSTGGAGQGDSNGGNGKKTLSQFTKEQMENGVPPNSPEFVSNMKTQQEAGLLEI